MRQRAVVTVSIKPLFDFRSWSDANDELVCRVQSQKLEQISWKSVHASGARVRQVHTQNAQTTALSTIRQKPPKSKYWTFSTMMRSPARCDVKIHTNERTKEIYAYVVIKFSQLFWRQHLIFHHMHGTVHGRHARSETSGRDRFRIHYVCCKAPSINTWHSLC